MGRISTSIEKIHYQLMQELKRQKYASQIANFEQYMRETINIKIKVEPMPVSQEKPAPPPKKEDK